MNRSNCNRISFAVLYTLCLGLASYPSTSLAQNSDNCFSAKFISKMHSELLGVVVSPATLTVHQDYLSGKACNQDTIKEYVANKYSLRSKLAGLSAREIAFMLARAVYPAEPTLATVSYIESSIEDAVGNNETGISAAEIAAAIDAVLLSTDFEAVALPHICQCYNDEESAIPSDVFVEAVTPSQPPARPTAVSVTTGEELQAVLNEAEPGTTVLLRRGSAVKVSQLNGVTIPSGVTLATERFPSPAKYIQMARIVPAKESTSLNTLVTVKVGGGLRNVWLDGLSKASLLANAEQGDFTRILKNKMSNARSAAVFAGSNMIENSVSYNRRKALIIESNLITSYNLKHVQGIMIASPNTVVRLNGIIDTSTGIEIYPAYRWDDSETFVHKQASQVTKNTVVVTDRRAIAAITVRGLGEISNYPSSSIVYLHFHKLALLNNIFGTGKHGLFQSVILLDGDTTFGDRYAIQPMGGLIQGNTDGRTSKVSPIINTALGVVINNFQEVTVKNNKMRFNMQSVYFPTDSTGVSRLCLKDITNYPGLLVAFTTGRTSGDFFHPYLDATIEERCYEEALSRSGMSSAAVDESSLTLRRTGIARIAVPLSTKVIKTDKFTAFWKGVKNYDNYSLQNYTLQVGSVQGASDILEVKDTLERKHEVTIPTPTPTGVWIRLWTKLIVEENGLSPVELNEYHDTFHLVDLETK